VSNENFIFWDLETTGRNEKYNQITQAGAILTDKNFNIKDKIEIHSKLREGKWFEPGALLTTGVEPLGLFGNNYPSYYEAVAQLYETFLEWSNPSAIFIGYNSISFDGPFLRQAFYQNLMPEIYMPVTSGNTQMDVFDIAKLVSVFHPEHIRVNKDEKGYAILKLESLAEANDLKIQYDAGPHDAVYDALITLELAKMLSIRCPKIFEASLEFRKRDTPKKFMLENNVFTNLTFWGRRPSIKAQTLISGIPERNHSYLVYNLLFDPEEMSKLDEKELCKKTIDGTNRITEVFDGSKSKTLLNESYCFKDSKFAEIGIDTLRKRAKFIRENEEFSSRLVECHLKNSKTWPEPIEIEERIFENFPSNADKKTMIGFHTSPNSKKYEVSKQFEDTRYQELATRVIYEIARQTLPKLEKNNYELEIRERFNDDDTVKWNSKNKILKLLETEVDKFIENEQDKILFRQKVMAFLNSESAKWS
jgi:exodeoxyribonuclease-1